MSILNQNFKTVILVFAIAFGLMICSEKAQAADQETAIVAGGCFWCVESDFESLRGVISAESGYTGGAQANPTYKQVTKGGSGHYEAVRITYDPNQLSYDQILSLFFRSVDPTDAGGQFCDRGNSYRTAIFVENAAQKKIADAEKSKAASALGQKIVTPVLDAKPFYPAEDYHQDYYKGSKLILTRFGPKKQAEAYTLYRQSCGRDERVQALWGSDAPFVKKYLN